MYRFNKQDVCNILLGPHHVERVVKATLSGVLELAGPDQQQRDDAKQRVITGIRRVVDTLQAVSLRVHQFLSYYILRRLAQDHALPEDQRQGLPAIMLTQRYMYGPLQLVSGRAVTSDNPQVPQDQAEAYEEFQQEMGFDDHINTAGMSNSMTYLALDIATSFRNSIVSNFKRRALQYLAFRVRQALPQEVNLTSLLNSLMCRTLIPFSFSFFFFVFF